MKICNNNNIEFDFSKYLQCKSNSIKVVNHLERVKEDQQVASIMKERILSFEGNFEADRLEDVDHFRSEVFEKLYNKLLLVYLEDNSPRFYKCILDGNVNTTYNHGWEVGKVFTLSFNLITLEPYVYEPKITELLYPYNNSFVFKQNLLIFYSGTVETLPVIRFEHLGDVLIKASAEPFIKINNTEVKIAKDIKLKLSDTLEFSDGFLLINGNIEYKYLTAKSCLNPLRLLAGPNHIFINYNLIKQLKNETNTKISINYEPIFY